MERNIKRLSDNLARWLANRRRAWPEPLPAGIMTDAVLRCDGAGLCVHASGSTAAVLGVEPAAFIGRPVGERMHGDARERIERAQQRILSGASAHERFTYRRLPDAPDGSAVFIEAECAATCDPRSGQPDGLVIVARDASERVELGWQLARAQRQAGEAIRAKSEFLARMSHAIRNPMTGVMGCAELLLESELDPEQRRHARMVVESGRSMMLMLGDIIDLSRIETGEIAIDYAPVDLRATVEHCVALHRPNALRKGLALECAFVSQLDGQLDGRPGEAAQPEWPWVVTDALRLRQIVLGLLENAVGFTERGAVRLRCTIAPEHFSVEVTDTGIGMDAARLARIFQPFAEGQGDPARRVSGAGLSLPIGRQLAQLLGGTIAAESAPGTGSCFTLTLPGTPVDPRAEADPDLGLGAPTADDPAPPVDEIGDDDEPRVAPLQPARILLAEDHDLNRTVIGELLEHCGQTVAHAHDGNEAIAMVFDAVIRGRPYDLVLMDLHMPGCDGRAAARTIRAEGIAPWQLPIVALSSHGLPETLAELREAGMQDHLPKPVELAALARMLQRWMPSRILDSSRSAPPDCGNDR